jgi:hypothetical protein
MSTFRHIKLADSEVMRSLEIVAHKKGWIPEEQPKPMVKQASATTVEATDNLDENILKLASELRANNFDQYANALEERLVNYKMAKVNLYKAFKETGEDFLEEAHPEGDPNLTDAPEGMVEGLITRHKKIIDMINKKPTGKVASVSDVINQVKIALEPAPVGGAREISFPKDWFPKNIETAGPLEPVVPQATGGILSGLLAKLTGTAAGAVFAIATSAIIGGIEGYSYFENKFYAEELNDAVNNLFSELSDIEKYSDEYNEITSSIDKLKTNIKDYNSLASQLSSFKENPSVDGIKKLDALEKSALAISTSSEKIREYMKTILKETYHTNLFGQQTERGGGVHPDLILWKTKAAQFNDVELAAAQVSQVITNKTLPALTTIANVVQKAVDNASSPTGEKSSEQLIKDFNTAITNIDSYMAKVQASSMKNKDALLGWLEATKKQAASLLNEFNGEAPGIKERMHDRFAKELATLTGYLTQVASKLGK